MDSLNKSTIRQRLIQHRSAMQLDAQAKANIAIQKTILKRWNPNWQTILMYVNQPDEVATVPLILELIENGKRLCVPTFDRNVNRYYPSELKDFENEMESGNFGILEPKTSARRPIPVSEVDVIFLPGVGFDRQGYRLGYGYGYFDQICRASSATKIGLAYEFQIVDEIPVHDGDVKMDLIITEKGVIECPKP